jgi:hypothetical protein
MTRLRNPAMSPAEATVLIEQGYLETDGVTPTQWHADSNDFDPITEQLIEDYTS